MYNKALKNDINRIYEILGKKWFFWYVVWKKYTNTI
jgi:hypothetical protein